MKRVLITIGVVLSLAANAEEAVIIGGRSPDRRYEIRIKRVDRDKYETEYIFQVHDVRAHRVLTEILGGDRFGYDQIRDEEAKALWNGAAAYVAVRDRGTSHGSTVTLLRIDDRGASQVPLPDYVEAALAKIGAKEIDTTCHSYPVKWEGDRLFLNLGFEVPGKRGPRVAHGFRIVLEVQNGEAKIVSVEEER
jgi:hypothetical protein